MNPRKSVQYTLNIKSPITSRAGLTLSVPSSWDVHRVKELILQFHPESPPVSAQQLFYKAKNLQNSSQLYNILGSDSEHTLILHIDMNFRVTDPDYTSEIFRTREKEYLTQYQRAIGILQNSDTELSQSECFSSSSILTTLPLMHSDALKRIYKMCVPNRSQNKIKLKPFSLQNYLDFVILFRAGLFLIIIFFFTGLNSVINLSLVMILFYM